MESDTSVGIQNVRLVAAVLLANTSDPASVDRAAQLIRAAAEAENQIAQAAKYAAEEKKLNDDLSDSKGRRTREEIRAYITSLSPVIATVLSTLALAGTLFLQYAQYKSQRQQADTTAKLQVQAAKDQRDSATHTLVLQEQAAKDQRNSAIRTLELQQEAANDQRISAARTLELQTRAAEDTRWNESVKVLTSDTRLSPTEALLSTFSQSPRYEKQARSMAAALLVKSKTLQDFTTTFNDVFTPLNWSNLQYALEVDRDIEQIRNPIALKAYDENLVFHEDRIKDQANLLYLCEAELSFISSKISPVLRSERPPGSEPLDMTFIALMDADLHGTDFRGTTLTSAKIARADMKDADLSRVARWENFSFDRTAWWEARAIDGSLLDHILADRTSQYDENSQYGITKIRVSKNDYERALFRLQNQAKSSK